MRSFIVMSSVTAAVHAAILSPSPAGAPQDPTITAAPEIPFELMRKQNGNRFMGWIKLENGWTTGECEQGATLWQSGDFWRCCGTAQASCPVPLGCVSGSLIYPYTESGTTGSTSYVCSSLYTDPEDKTLSLCNTGYMYENSLDADPQTNIFCGDRASVWSYYRAKPAEAESTSSSSPASTPASTDASPTGITAPTNPPLPSPLPEKKESKAWIAGAVVGPVVGLALIGVLAWFLIAKRKKKNTAAAAAAGGVASTAPNNASPSYPGSPQQGYYQPVQQTGAPGFVPYGVGVQDNYNGAYGANEAKHQSWAPPQSPYQQPGAPQMTSANPGSPPPAHSLPQYGVSQGGESQQFTNELPGSEPGPRSPQDGPQEVPTTKN